MNDYDPIFQQIEVKEAASRERVRQVLYEKGRPDLVAEMDTKLHDLDTGVYGAQTCWHSISPAQREVLRKMAESGGHLWQNPNNPNAFYMRLGASVVRVGRATVRALVARELLAWDGGAFTPEAKAIITERGLFVLKHGAGIERP